MNEDNLRKYKRKLLNVFLETADPMTYDEIDYKLGDIEVPSSFLKKMLESLETKNIICTEPHNGETTYILTHFGRRRLTVIMQRKKVQQAARRRKTVGGVVLLAVVLCLLGWCIFFADGQFSAPKPTEPPITTEEPDTDFEKFTLTEDAMATGSLILVNSSNEFTAVPSDLTNIGENIPDLSVYSDSLSLCSEAVEALKELSAAYKKVSEDSEMVVYSAYVSREKQNETYNNAVSEHDEAYAAENYQKGGFSDNETGLALSFVVRTVDSDGDTSLSAFNGSDFQKWMNEHAAEYGFILRFPEGKEDKTGFTAHYSFFRYVGPVHATYIADNGITLEEYLELLRSSHVGPDNALAVTVGDKAYDVYYVSGLEVKVPKKGAYSFSGDNSGGFVVTVEKSE